MKLFKNTLAVLAVTSLLFSCNEGGEKTESNEKNMIEVSTLSVDADPVCHMKLGEGSIADTVTYEGKVYGFCAPGCKEKFMENPASFLVEETISHDTTQAGEVMETVSTEVVQESH